VGHFSNVNWVWIDETYSHEKGVNPLGGAQHLPVEIRNAYLNADHEDALDLTELIAFKIKEHDDRFLKRQILQGIDIIAYTEINEVNYRLREAGIGYQLENGKLTRVDSFFVHNEVVKPAMALISNAGFEGVQEEFLKAHAHYRAGQNKEAVSMAANALESTFKAIFDAKGWAYHNSSRITELAKVAKNNGLWPDYLDKSFDQLLATLQSGLPKIRDNDASHGQGSSRKEVPTYLAAYALHLAASKIVFLVSASDAKP